MAQRTGREVIVVDGRGAGTPPPGARLSRDDPQHEPALGPGANAASVCADYLASGLIAHVSASHTPE